MDFFVAKQSNLFWKRLVQTPVRSRSSRDDLAAKDPEKEFQRKLNQPRIRSRRRAGDYPKIFVVGREARGIRRSKLRSVEDVKKFGAKLSLLAAREWTQNSCIVCSFAASNQKSTHAWLDPLLRYASASNRKRKADIIAVKPTPVFLDSKEEIGWKAPLQNSNLWQEVV